MGQRDHSARRKMWWWILVFCIGMTIAQPTEGTQVEFEYKYCWYFITATVLTCLIIGIYNYILELF